MLLKIKNIFQKRSIYFIIVSYFVINLSFLENFPFIHSDEAWLSGLSKTMLENKSFAVTESFFDLMPRFPHALKIFFHLIQIAFIKIFSYQIFTFRLISLLAACFSLYIFFKITFLTTDSKKLSLYSAVILAVDIHFIYTSHLARQEIILVFIFLNAFYFYLKNVVYQSKKNNNKFNNNKFKTINQQSNTSLAIKNDIIMGIILGSAIGIHPNAFIIAMPLILIYSYNLFYNKNIKLKNYLSFGITLAAIALFFIWLSFRFDPNFLSHYSSYGARLGVLDSFAVKLNNFKNFYLKLFYQISGTYYIPKIKFQLIFFGFTLLIALVKMFFVKDKINSYLILSLAAINLAYFIIGRYNQTSIIFIFPISYLLFINLIKNVDNFFKKIMLISLVLILTVISFNSIINDSHYNYKNYLNEIAAVVESEAEVLANLNTAYYFKSNNLHDYRNLAYLDNNNLTFKEYIIKNKIEYIIYPEEMDYIYNHRPTWNILYGNLYPYYSEMKNFLKNDAILIKEFKNSTYPMRIVKEIAKKEWSIKIYQLNSEVLTVNRKKAD